MLRDRLCYVGFDELKDKYREAGYSIITDEANYSFTASNGKSAVVCLMPGAYNIRNSKEAKEYAYEMIDEHTPAARNNYTLDDILVVVYDGCHGHHYLGKNIAYFDSQTGIASATHLTKEVRREYKLLKLSAKRKKAAKNAYRYSHPELIRYSVFPLIVLIMATVYTYLHTMDYETWGYTARAVLHENEPYRLMTYMFAHNGLKHLVGNMIGLLLIGGTLIKVVGTVHFSIIYFGGGIAAAVLNSVYTYLIGGDTSTVVVGASGAIFATMGALLSEAFIDHDLENKKLYIIAFAISMLITCNTDPSVSIGTHIFGFIVGVILGIILGRERLRRFKINKNDFITRKKYYDEKEDITTYRYRGPVA